MPYPTEPAAQAQSWEARWWRLRGATLEVENSVAIATVGRCARVGAKSEAAAGANAAVRAAAKFEVGAQAAARAAATLEASISYPTKPAFQAQALEARRWRSCGATLEVEDSVATATVGRCAWGAANSTAAAGVNAAARAAANLPVGAQAAVRAAGRLEASSSYHAKQAAQAQPLEARRWRSCGATLEVEDTVAIATMGRCARGSPKSETAAGAQAAAPAAAEFAVGAQAAVRAAARLEASMSYHTKPGTQAQPLEVRRWRSCGATLEVEDSVAIATMGRCARGGANSEAAAGANAAARAAANAAAAWLEAVAVFIPTRLGLRATHARERSRLV